MSEFWHKAATLLKPGGTIALWTCASLYCRRLSRLLLIQPWPTYINLDPSTPNASEVQRILSRLEDEDLSPYELPSNRLSRDMYDNLQLPWQNSLPVKEFPESLYVKHEFNRNGTVLEGNDFFSGNEEQSLEGLEKALVTASMVTRWREANPNLAGTQQDCVKRSIRDLKFALGGKESFITGSGTAVLLFKKS